jgi:dTDP-glucose 4,6-dehydratase
MRDLERVLVAGGAGFIGSNFVRMLLAKMPNAQITVLDKLTYAGNLDNLSDVLDNPRVQFVHGDICNKELVFYLAKHQQVIINFAAETHVDRSLIEAGSFVLTDVYGTYVLLEAAKKFKHEVFLLVSTDEVYGHVSQGRSREIDPLKPRSPYSASKAGGELIARSYVESFGLPVVITRGSNTYGPYQYPEKIIPLFITNAIDDIPLPVYGDGSAVRDYMYVEDHCEAILTVLLNGKPGEVYNIGTGSEISGIAVAKAILSHLDKPETLIEFVKDRPGHDYRYAVDTTKLAMLGWQPKWDFDTGLKATIEWYLTNQSWWRKLKSRDFWEYYELNYKKNIVTEDEHDS